MCNNLPISFRNVRGFEKYDIDNHGRVWSNDYNHTMTRKEMRQYLDQDGYPYVFFQINGKRYKKMIHRLVAENFLKQPSKKHQVNHKNSIRNDNHLANLEWLTSRENTLHGWANGRQPSEKNREQGKKLAKMINEKRWGTKS